MTNWKKNLVGTYQATAHVVSSREWVLGQGVVVERFQGNTRLTQFPTNCRGGEALSLPFGPHPFLNSKMNRNQRNKTRQKGPRRGGRGRGVGGVRGGGGAVSGRNAFPGLSYSNTQPGMNIRSQPLFGLRTRRNLPYANSFISVTSGAGTAGAYVFSANGLFDPNITGTGGQPMGFDQMMTFYNHYTCLRSRIRVIANATTSSPPVIALAVTGSSVALTSVEQIMEVGRINMVWLSGTGIYGNKATLQASCNCARFQGVQNIMDDPDMRGDAAANPAEQMYYIIYVWYPIDSTVVSASLSVFLEYDTMFHEPKSASLSLKSQVEEKRRVETKTEEEFIQVPGLKNPLLSGVMNLSLHHDCPVSLFVDSRQSAKPPDSGG